ncbi:MAG: hypothetical protein RIQ81_1033 [Pseudomonadota bacterium]
MGVFKHSDYRTAIKQHLVELKKAKGRSLSFAALAAAMRVQHTYLSTVLSGNGHLSSDQVFIAIKYLALTEREAEYLSLLHEHNRSTFAERKLILKKQMDQLSSEHLKTQSHAPSPVMADNGSDAVIAFYLDINALFVHMFLSIDSYRSQPEKVREQLHLSRLAFEKALDRCEKAQLIHRAPDGIKIIKENIHLPPDSPLFSAFRVAMRLKALELLQNAQTQNDYSLSVLYSAKSDTQQEVREKFLDFLKWVQKKTQSDRPDTVFQLNFDLLRWSR